MSEAPAVAAGQALIYDSSAGPFFSTREQNEISPGVELLELNLRRGYKHPAQPSQQ
jgi:hypothetical protein